MTPMLRAMFFLALSIAPGVSIAAVAGPAALTGIAPAGAGFSRERLERMNEFMSEATGSGRYLGAVTLVARHGRIVDWRAHGFRDLARSAPMSRDSIFRIYSMTKTVTSVAVLMLMEDGRIMLEEPVSKYLPEFANMQVFDSGTADDPVLRPAARPITIHQLLTHTAGFACDGPDGSEAVRLYRRTELRRSRDLAEFCATLSRLPLATDPGEAYAYGVSSDVLGRLVEVVAGMPFDAFLRQRIFDPLGMGDTGFEVPQAERSRIAEICSTGPDGALIPAVEPELVGVRPGDRLKPYFGGAGGLYSTAADYFRFAQMLLDDGKANGVAILSRKTVELMMTNQLAHLGPSIPGLSPGDGFGIGGRVLVDETARGRLGSRGQFGWSGAGTTYYTIDPVEDLVAILLVQHIPQDPHKVSGRFYNLVFGALED